MTGNTLEKPSLLLKRAFVRDTTYQTKNNGQISSNNDAEIGVPSYQRQYTQNCMNRVCISPNTTNIYHNNLQGFLKNPPMLVLNLKANADNEFVVKNVNFEKYSIVQILIGDQKQQLTMRKFNVSTNQPVEKKDLRLMDPLDSKKFYNEVRNSFTLSVGQDAFVIQDISSA